MNTDEEVEYLRGAYNGLILEVTEDAITLSSPKPCFELDELFVVTMPQYSNEKLAFARREVVTLRQSREKLYKHKLHG